jgi:hypothetical protein
MPKEQSAGKPTSRRYSPEEKAPRHAHHGRQTTPSMAARIERRVWTHRDIAALLL